MDLRIGPEPGPARKIRILPRGEERVRAVWNSAVDATVARNIRGNIGETIGRTVGQAVGQAKDRAKDQGPKAEAAAARWVERTRPAWSWFAIEWRRLGTVAAVVLIVGLLLHALFGANGMVVYRQKRAETKTLEGEVERLQTENSLAVDQIKALKSDPAAIEKEAREQLHYTRPGEIVYVSPQAPAKPPTGRAQK